MRKFYSQSHAVSNGPKNATGPPTEFAKSNPTGSNVHLQTNAFSPLQSISPSHISRDHTHHNIKYLEQLLDSSLATVAVIQFSGNTLADVLTPRAYDTFKALYALADLDAPAPRTKSTRSTFSNADCSYSSNRSSSPPLPNSLASLAVPRTGRIHISITVDYFMLFSWAGLAAVFFLVVFFNCLSLAKG